MTNIIAIAALAASAAAQASNLNQPGGESTLVTTVEACRPIADNAARLACFDRAVAAMASARARGDIKVVDRNELRQVRRSLFGFAIPKLPFFGGGSDADRRSETEQKKLAAKLQSLRPIGNGFFRFSIDEPDSTWESTEGSFLGDAKSGTLVKIEKGAMGAYFAQIGDDRWVRVRRIR